MPAPVISWSEASPPTEADIVRRLHDEGLQPLSWSNGPGDRYAVHQHPYTKVLYCLQGGVRFTLPQDCPTSDVELIPGDRLELPAETPHGAIVGPEGCRCIEAARWTKEV